VGQRILHLDAFSGIAGNMFLGALLDAGLARRDLVSDLDGLGLPHSLRISRVRRGALDARYVKVGLPRRSPTPRARTRGAGKTAHGHGRHYSEIRKILERARLDASVRRRAQEIFAALAEAEARVHGIPVARVHFHEVGAVDAIVDVTGAAIALARLGIERVTSSPVALGHGTVDTAHGRLPLPAPATLELLRGVPTVPAHVAWETVTPTGAAILRSIVDEFRTLPAMTPESIGHGAGDDRPGALPNVLRAIVGRSGAATFDRVVALETNLDDLIPEHFDHVMDQLFEQGALDVSIQHVLMKKNRPGFLLRVIATPERRNALSELLFAETTTLGVRLVESDRVLLPRQLRKVQTPFGPIRVKVWTGPDGRPEVSAEYDDCKRAARKGGVPLRQVIRVAEEAGRELEGSS
jgi:uncharacterized protein (TIGR00299 family) protein